MNKTLVIIGAGGHGRVISDIALKCGNYENIIFLDDAAHTSIPIVGRVKDFVNYLDRCDFVIAVGNNDVRERIYKDLQEYGAAITTLIHPNAIIANDVKIGNGTVVMAGAVINTGASIGNGVILNTCSSVDHDCVLEDFCHISVGAHLAGTVKVGRSTFVGAGATIINNINICGGCTIGAGGVVVRELREAGIYIGVPAKKHNNGAQK